jgi:small subunit ribosomal protein S6
MREYEIMIITRVDTPEAELSKKVAKWEGIMTHEGGELIKKDSWGTKRLAYQIKKQSRGVYNIYDISSTQENMKELHRVLKFDESVLRFMIIKLSDDVNVEDRKLELQRLAAEAAKRAAEAGKERAEFETMSSRRQPEGSALGAE